jgi:hypothetical protein
MEWLSSQTGSLMVAAAGQIARRRTIVSTPSKAEGAAVSDWMRETARGKTPIMPDNENATAAIKLLSNTSVPWRTVESSSLNKFCTSAAKYLLKEVNAICEVRGDLMKFKTIVTLRNKIQELRGRDFKGKWRFPDGLVPAAPKELVHDLVAGDDAVHERKRAAQRIVHQKALDKADKALKAVFSFLYLEDRNRLEVKVGEQFAAIEKALKAVRWMQPKTKGDDEVSAIPAGRELKSKLIDAYLASTRVKVQGNEPSSDEEEEEKKGGDDYVPSKSTKGKQKVDKGKQKADDFQTEAPARKVKQSSRKKKGLEKQVEDIEEEEEEDGDATVRKVTKLRKKKVGESPVIDVDKWQPSTSSKRTKKAVDQQTRPKRPTPKSKETISSDDEKTDPDEIEEELEDPRTPEGTTHSLSEVDHGLTELVIGGGSRAESREKRRRSDEGTEAGTSSKKKRKAEANKGQFLMVKSLYNY